MAPTFSGFCRYAPRAWPSASSSIAGVKEETPICNGRLWMLLVLYAITRWTSAWAGNVAGRHGSHLSFCCLPASVPSFAHLTTASSIRCAGNSGWYPISALLDSMNGDWTPSRSRLPRAHESSPTRRSPNRSPKSELHSVSRTSRGAFRSQLSGGMRKRVRVARALSSSPEISCTDAATRGRSGHQPPGRRLVVAHLETPSARLTSVIISHDMVGACKCGRTLPTFQGKSVAYGFAERAVNGQQRAPASISTSSGVSQMQSVGEKHSALD